jgi:Zn-dependent peptidase ImmA (M78 family)
MKKGKNKKEIITQLYAAMFASSEIPLTETSEIHSKGMFISKDGKQNIYIKQSLSITEKLKVLLHEYGHYVHLTHYFQDENRAECEIIANGAASFICREYGLNIYKDFDAEDFSDDPNVVARLTSTIETVAGHILQGVSNTKG